MGQSASYTAPRSTVSCPGLNNLPPLSFHQEIHGDNIRISRDGTTAKRYESFCKGITFTGRPVKVNERVCVRFSEISNNWSGVIRFGFTNNDPASLRNSLPKYACPELTNKPGYWAKALNERYCERENILFFYVTSAGVVYFGINGEEKGVFIMGVDTRSPLWALIDVYGNCTSIELLDPRICTTQTQNCRSQRRSVPSEPPAVDSVISSMESMEIRNDTPPMPQVRPNNPETRLVPVKFHRTKGRNVRFTADQSVAVRLDTEFCQGYVFTSRPLRIEEKLIVQVLRTEYMYVGSLALGLTSCDPSVLNQSDLPDDSDLLLDRPEYWVVRKDVCTTPQCGDELTFWITASGEVQVSKNGGTPAVIMHVDQSLQLWAFLDVYGSTQSVRVLSQPPPQPRVQPQSPRRLQVSLPGSESMSSISSQPEIRKVPVHQTTTSRVINLPTNDMIQLQPGGTVLVVNLPPTADAAQQQQQQTPQPRIAQVPMTLPGSSATVMSNYSNTYIEPIKISASTPLNPTIACQELYPGNVGTGAECTICYENPIDSVLYMCGHMCMCYDCAIQQWRGIGGGHCPLCRAIIRDVIRTYKS